MKPEEKKIQEIDSLKPKEYDINVILEEARKNREKYDELEKRRKLKENSYVKMADINDKNEDVTLRKSEINEEELTNLINTITSHNLLKDIKEAEEKAESNNGDEDILSDLLATNVNQKITEGIAKEYTSPSVETKIDNSFYTKSMDLSDHDFELSEEIERESRIKFKIVLIVVIILLIIFAVAFLVLKGKGIINF